MLQYTLRIKTYTRRCNVSLAIESQHLMIAGSTNKSVRSDLNVKSLWRNRKVNETYLEVEVCLTFYRPRAPTKVK